VSAAAVKPEISHLEWTPETVFRRIVLLDAVLRIRRYSSVSYAQYGRIQTTLRWRPEVVGRFNH